MTEPEPLAQIERNHVQLKNRKLLYFSGCDYFRLARHPRVLDAAKRALTDHGLNVAASRLTTGNHALFGELERGLCAFFDAPDALLAATGYITNLIVSQGLAGNFSHVLIDERAHPSLFDAAPILDCPVLKFRHQSVEDVAAASKRCGPGAGIILLTDGMFAYDGSAAPIRQYLEVLPKDAMLLVDDAHGAGVLGKTGKGTLEHARVPRRRVIQTITLSKAFGAYGGAILATSRLRRQIIERSRLFAGHTPLPLPLAAAAIESIRLLGNDPSFRQRLNKNVDRLKSGLREASFPSDELSPPGPIVYFRPASTKASNKLERDFLRAGILPPITRYPGMPAKGHFRCVISSEHTTHELQRLLAVLTDAC